MLSLIKLLAFSVLITECIAFESSSVFASGFSSVVLMSFPCLVNQEI